MAVKLNIGSGLAELQGFISLDRKLGHEAYPLKQAANSVDEIRASHILEHFGFGEVPQVLDDWFRVLKPGGRMRIAVPDFDKIAAAREDPKRLLYAMGGQTGKDDFHKSAFTEATLSRAMSNAGLQSIAHWTSDNGDCASLPISLNLEGVKPQIGLTAAPIITGDDDKISVRVMAITSIPRLGWQDHWGCVDGVLGKRGIPLSRFSGAFWGQHMQTAMEAACAQELDWILTLDYDTLFTTKHLDRLLGIFGKNPHIDALASLQTGRHRDTPLMTIKKDGVTQLKAEINGSPLKVNTAHFGLTLIRVEKLRQLPKPWMHHQPGPDGTWTHVEHVDPDIWFWKQWGIAGHSLYVDPMCRVGHIEMCVSQFNENMDHQILSIKEWRETNGLTLEKI